MTNHRTAEEARQNYIEHMGESLGKIFFALWQEVALLYMKWNVYVELYGTRESRVLLLNNAAPDFFSIVQDVLFEDTLLHIARLTDRPMSAGKENLTIHRLPDAIPQPKAAESIKELNEIVEKSTQFCRDWRNRRIAHRDLNLAIEGSVSRLEPATRQKVKEALASITTVLNAVTRHHMDSTTCFDTGDPGVMELLYVLDDGLKARAEARERLQRGEYRHGDLGPRDL